MEKLKCWLGALAITGVTALVYWYTLDVSLTIAFVLALLVLM